MRGPGVHTVWCRVASAFVFPSPGAPLSSLLTRWTWSLAVSGSVLKSNSYMWRFEYKSASWISNFQNTMCAAVITVDSMNMIVGGGSNGFRFLKIPICVDLYPPFQITPHFKPTFLNLHCLFPWSICMNRRRVCGSACGARAQRFPGRRLQHDWAHLCDYWWEHRHRRADHGASIYLCIFIDTIVTLI